MCFTVLLVDLGPADACIDTDRRELYLHRDRTAPEHVALARALLDASGIDQRPDGVTCVCGAALDMPASGCQVAG